MQIQSTISAAPAARHFWAPILRQRNVAPGHYRVTFLAPALAATARAGQFVHLSVHAQTQQHSLNRPFYDPLLRRAFSVLSVNGDEFEILYRVEGQGTHLMSQWPVGSFADILGPLGNGFAPPPKHAILVGGGVGVPPMAMLAAQHLQGENQSMLALIGARSAAEVICCEDFEKFRVPLRVAADDGSREHHGYVTDLLGEALTNAPSDALVYACGPLAMLRAVARLCAKYQVPCQVSLKENMPCGVGVCNGCVVPVVEAGDDYGSFRRICVEGPAYWGHEIDWNRIMRVPGGDA